MTTTALPTTAPPPPPRRKPQPHHRPTPKLTTRTNWTNLTTTEIRLVIDSHNHPHDVRLAAARELIARLDATLSHYHEQIDRQRRAQRDRINGR